MYVQKHQATQMTCASWAHIAYAAIAVRCVLRILKDAPVHCIM